MLPRHHCGVGAKVMKIKILGTAFAAAGILLYGSAAKADQITLGASTVGEFSFAGSTNPPNSITVTVGPAGLTGTGTLAASWIWALITSVRRALRPTAYPGTISQSIPVMCRVW